MQENSVQRKEPKNFLEEYHHYIKPKINELDIFVKSSNERMDINQAADILGISPEEVKLILAEKQIYELNSFSFFIVMENGSSPICQLFRREMEKGSPYVYCAEDISYIYEIKLDIVENAFESMGTHCISYKSLDGLFESIPPCCSSIIGE